MRTSNIRVAPAGRGEKGFKVLVNSIQRGSLYATEEMAKTQKEKLDKAGVTW